eukprot:6596472-Alexandrium_andersonii.AAC.1
MLLLQLARIWGVAWALEQPGSSIMIEHPKFRTRARRLGTRRTFCWMKGYGGKSPKGTVLYGDAAFLKALRNRLPRSALHASKDLKLTARYEDPGGSTKFTG